MGYELNLAQKIILFAIPIIFAITVHEVAHGWVANKLGDHTAKLLGRLTLNPFKHVDIVGTIIVPALLIYLGGFIFGWAKPVPVDWRNLKNPRRDMALVAAAGPLANLGMIFIWLGLLKLGTSFANQGMAWGAILALMSRIGIQINLILMVLNFIPIPPLDGSKVLMSFLPPRTAAAFSKMEPYGFFILLALLATGVLSAVMGPIVSFLSQIIL